jgi:hypothetical protein
VHRDVPNNKICVFGIDKGGFNAASLWLVIAEGCGEVAKLLPKRCFDLLPAASKKTFGPLHFLAKK